MEQRPHPTLGRVGGCVGLCHHAHTVGHNALENDERKPLGIDGHRVLVVEPERAVGDPVGAVEVDADSSWHGESSPWRGIGFRTGLSVTGCN